MYNKYCCITRAHKESKNCYQSRTKLVGSKSNLSCSVFHFLCSVLVSFHFLLFQRTYHTLTPLVSVRIFGLLPSLVTQSPSFSTFSVCLGGSKDQIKDSLSCSCLSLFLFCCLCFISISEIWKSLQSGQ